MRIGFVGAGNIGTALARNLVALDHDVALSNSRGPDTLTELVAQLGPTATAVTTQEAIAFSDLVVVTIPLKAVPDLPADAFAGKTVIDTCNYYPERDGQIDVLDRDEQTETEYVQAQLAQAQVVKAFNSISSAHLAEQGVAGRAPGSRRGIPIAGASAAAKTQVAQLIDQLGFDPVDAGPLSNTRRFQNGGDLYGAELTGDELAAALGV